MVVVDGSMNDVAAIDDLLHHHPIPSIIVDRGGMIIAVNQAIESFFNLSRSAIIGRRLTQMLSMKDDSLQPVLDDASASLSAYGVVMDAGRARDAVADIAADVISPDKDWRIVALHPSPRGGRHQHHRPGSAARSATAAAAMLAHEIKNPLAGIRGAAQLMTNVDAERASMLRELICSEVDRIAQLIDSMQDFTRDTAPSLAATNIYPALTQATEIARAAASDGIAIIDSFDPSIPQAWANHQALVQIILNLLTNAIAAVSDISSAEITISTAFRHGLKYYAGDGMGHRALPIEICVSDNGSGVPPHLVDDIFNPFVSGRTGGQGLGLALVDKLVRDMGGLVQHERDEKMERTHFRVHLCQAREG